MPRDTDNLLLANESRKASDSIRLLSELSTSTSAGRNSIVSQADIAEALGRLELRDGHSLGHSEPTEDNPDELAPV